MNKRLSVCWEPLDSVCDWPNDILLTLIEDCPSLHLLFAPETSLTNEHI